MLLIVNPRARTAAALATLAAAPTASQIHAAVHRAEHSKLLWATVNICNTKHHRHMVGIRGQMPSLPFATTMSMKIQVDYWNGGKFVPDPHATKRISLGDPANRVVQGGANFTFHPPVILSGTVSFEWKLAGKPIGRAKRLTGHGYKHVAGGDPPGYSTATCRMS